MSGRWCALVAVALLAGGVARASSVRRQEVRARAQSADRVVRAKVVSTETRLGPGGDVRRMITWSRLRVLEDWKGEGPAEVVLLQLGGRHGAWAARIPDDAELAAGEESVFFLRCRDTRFPGRCTLAGLKDARLRVRGQALYVEQLGAEGQVRPLRAVRAEVSASGTVKR